MSLFGPAYPKLVYPEEEANKMKFKHLILPAVGLVALLAVACDNGDTIVQNSNQGGIAATGTGRAFGEPDVAVINVGVNVQRDTVEQARADAATAQTAVIDSLKDNGVADEDIQTVGFSVYPQYDYPPNRPQGQIIGYVVSNVVTAKVRDLDTTGKVIDDATVAGGNDAVVQGVSFTIDDPKELQEEARREAVEQAKAQAEQLADAAGVKLGKLLSISESGGFFPVATGGRSFDSAAQVPETPIEPGQVEINISVNLQYALE
jgi:hypothetical protein